MTFRNTALFFFTILLLSSCKGLQYYKSGTNPAGISVILTCPETYYTNINQQDSVGFYLVNHNSETLIIPNWNAGLFLIGQSRFYEKEIFRLLKPNDQYILTSIIPPSDTTLLLKVAIKDLLSSEKNWLYLTPGGQSKTKNVWGPHLITGKNYNPYIYFTTEFTTKIPNQETVIKIRSEKIKIKIATYKEQNLKDKKTELGLSSDVKSFDTKTKKGNLFCKINNLTDTPIQLLSDPGAIRFKLYGYSPNRTAIMFTQYVLDNGKLPVNPLTINGRLNSTITIPLEQVLFVSAPEKPIYYWSWNKKSPPVSPLLYGKKDIAVEVEFWFGIMVDGQEFLSNTIKLSIDNQVKK